MSTRKIQAKTTASITNASGDSIASHNLGRTHNVFNTDDGSDPQISNSGLGALINQPDQKREPPPRPAPAGPLSRGC
jgi:hypothetical protein